MTFDDVETPIDGDRSGTLDALEALIRAGGEPGKQLAALAVARSHQERMLTELREAQADLRRALRMRDEFMSMVAHELRTPLGVMSLEIRMRQHQLEKDDTAYFGAERLGAMFTKDARQVRSMTRLIEDMLDMSRIRNGRLSIRLGRTDLSAVVTRAVKELAGQGQEIAVVLDVAPGIVGRWDEFRIEQVVVNLLGNAVRYGERRPVSVCLARHGDEALLVVRDQGIGIAPEDQQRIFEQFFRVGDGPGTPGMGLGLFISRHFVEAHGGTIEVQSALGEGARFTVRLPILPADDLPAGK